MERGRIYGEVEPEQMGSIMGTMLTIYEDRGMYQLLQEWANEHSNLESFEPRVNEVSSVLCGSRDIIRVSAVKDGGIVVCKELTASSTNLPIYRYYRIAIPSQENLSMIDYVAFGPPDRRSHGGMWHYPDKSAVIASVDFFVDGYNKMVDDLCLGSDFQFDPGLLYLPRQSNS